MQKFAATAFASILVVACGSQSPARDPDAKAAGEPEVFEAAFAKAMPLCEKWLLPNTQAQAPESDPEALLSRIEAEITALSKAFRSSGGRQFLQAKARDEADDIAGACAKKLLQSFSGETAEPPAKRGSQALASGRALG